MANINSLTGFLSDIANAIRSKEGSTENISPVDFDTRIQNLSGTGKFSPKFISFAYCDETNLNQVNINDFIPMLVLLQQFLNS